MRVSVVLSLLAAITMAAPAVEDEASIVARDDGNGVMPGEGGLISSRQGLDRFNTVCTSEGTTRVYGIIRIFRVVASQCPGQRTRFQNANGLDFGVASNAALYQIELQNPGSNRVVSGANRYDPYYRGGRGGSRGPRFPDRLIVDENCVGLGVVYTENDRSQGICRSQLFVPQVDSGVPTDS